MHISRSIVVGLFGMLAGGGAIAAACDGFTDVDSANATYCPAVTYLKNKGITLGCTGTTYCPNDYVTRLQMALFLQRMGRGSASNVLGDWTDSIGGGEQNSTPGLPKAHNVIGGGLNNTANGTSSTVAGGQGNTASGAFSFVGGGIANEASGSESAAMGFLNLASGANSTAIGFSNVAAGDGSVVLGTMGIATADAPGSFIFSDSTIAPNDAYFGGAAPNLFIVGASGGILLYTNKDYGTSCKILGGSGTWTCTSSKESKRDFSDVDRQDILERVVALPVQRWRYKNEPREIRHIGTFAQDFHDAFGVGADDKSISMADADGVALAAIQALHARVAELTRRLAALEALLNTR